MKKGWNRLRAFCAMLLVGVLCLGLIGLAQAAACACKDGNCSAIRGCMDCNQCTCIIMRNEATTGGNEAAGSPASNWTAVTLAGGLTVYNDSAGTSMMGQLIAGATLYVGDQYNGKMVQVALEMKDGEPVICGWVNRTLLAWATTEGTQLVLQGSYQWILPTNDSSQQGQRKNDGVRIVAD